MTRYFNEGSNLGFREFHHLSAEIADCQAQIETLRENMTDESRVKLVAAHTRLGEIHLQFFDVEEAEATLLNATELDPACVKALTLLGKIYLELGKYSEAETALMSARNAGDLEIETGLLLGDAKWNQRKVSEAEALYQEAIYNLTEETQRLARQGETLTAEIRGKPMALAVADAIKKLWFWRDMVERNFHARDLAKLEKIAAGRPLFITHIFGRGWVLSHMVSQIELFTKRLALAGVKDPLVVVINPNRFCNAPLTEMYGRVICLIDDRYPRLRRRLVALRERLKAENSPIAADIDPGNPIPHMRGSWNNFQREFAEAGTVLKFTDEEEVRGKQLLHSMNVEEGAPFVCMGIREKTYYRNAWVQDKEFDDYWEVALTPGEGTDAGAEMADDDARKRLANMEHVYSEVTDVLQTPIENYVPAMEKCAEDGLYVMRMGLDVDQPLPSDLDGRVIDYASDHRTEFGDVYLFARCKFLVSGAAGNNWIPQAFGRPFVVTDLYLPNAGVTNSCPDIPNLFIPRKYWVKDEKRFLKFEEMINCCRYYNWAQHCADDGIEHVPNAPDEIGEVVDEMNQRVDGTWDETPDDRELQSRYMALYRPRHEGYKMNGRIGAGFLRRHTSLL